ncbi:MAG: MerR family transcriptional regulator [Actinomycetota bacterium]
MPSKKPSEQWLTRDQAAAHVGMHYNTVRHWERKGLLRTMDRSGTRGKLLHIDDVEKAAAGAALKGPIGKTASIDELERRYNQLIDKLEVVLAAAKRSRSRVSNVREAQAKAESGSDRATRGPRRSRSR